MENLTTFFSWFFSAIWNFFKIPFPMLEMTIGQVLLGASCFYFAFRLLNLMLSVRVSASDAKEDE